MVWASTTPPKNSCWSIGPPDGGKQLRIIPLARWLARNCDGLNPSSDENIAEALGQLASISGIGFGGFDALRDAKLLKYSDAFLDNFHGIGLGIGLIGLGIDAEGTYEAFSAGDRTGGVLGIKNIIGDALALVPGPGGILWGAGQLGGYIAEQNIADTAETLDRDATFCMCSKVSTKMNGLLAQLPQIERDLQSMQDALNYLVHADEMGGGDVSQYMSQTFGI